MERAKVLEELSNHFDYNGRRIEFMSQFVLGMIEEKDVNLSKIADSMEGDSKIETKYRRIQKFFKDFEIDYKQTALFLSRFIEEDKWLIAIDRTNWKIGDQEINVLMLGVSYKGTAIPLIWELISEEEENKGKKGNSNTEERKNIIEKFLSIFSKEKIKSITADREFIGEDWFEYLVQSDLPFVIRVKKNFLIENENEELVQAHKLFKKDDLELENSTILGQKLNIVGKKLEKDYLILATNMNIQENNIFDIYQKRWGIETMFGVFKIGEFIHNIEPIPFKKKINYLAKSIFRNAISKITTTLKNLYKKMNIFLKTTEKYSITPQPQQNQ